MSTTSKSPRKVALAALRVGRARLADYSHPNSPRRFTQPQLFACLALKTFFKTDYRGICATLADCPSLQQAIGLCRVPHFTTLQKAARRLLVSPLARRLIEATVRDAMGAKPTVALAAVDSTGLDSHYCSSYFVRRRSREPSLWQTTTYKKFPKLAAVCDCGNHLILSTFTTRGPSPDINQLQQTLTPAASHVAIATLLADAGYDSNSNHVFARETLGIETIIPPKHGRPSKHLPGGRYRRMMALDFDAERYGQRWQVETVFSMIKRNLGSAVTSRTYWAQCRELNLMAITHNIMILRQTELFYRALSSPQP